MTDPVLTLMMFPRRWDPAGKLEICVATLPFTNPLEALSGASDTFAESDLALNIRIIPSLLHLPRSADALAPVSMAVQTRPNRSALFEQAQARFKIDKNPPAAEPAPGAVRVRKYLPASYRQSFAFSGPEHSLVSSDTAFRCALESAPKLPQPPFPDPEDRVTWGEILSYLLRNPALAKEAGMLYDFDLPVTTEFAEGGWLYAELQPGGSFAGLANINLHAARIPPLGNIPRPVFAAIQFPVDDIAANDDARVFIESESYSDGFAKIPHGAQPVGVGPLDTEPDVLPGSDRGTLPPSRDRGIRLGWDDEQIATWLNRQIGLDPFTGAAPQLKAPLAVLGYRVDVREGGGSWTSLVRVSGQTILGPIKTANVDLPALDLALFNGELAVETIPLNLQSANLGDFWLPSHYVAWTGGSLVISDPALLAINGHDDQLAEQPYTAVDADAVPLLYGHDYDFRVRLMDLASGGPASNETTDPAVPPAVARVPFRRYVPPRSPLALRSDGLADPAPPLQLELRRPRLGYPDIVFAAGPGVIPDLLAERDRLLAIPDGDRSEEVALPDPDVASVRISVAVRQLGLDESEFRELYTIARDFPNDANLPLTLDIAYVDVHDIATLTAPGPQEALPIPTARQVRIEFQSVCKPDAMLKYFGNDQVRFSVASTILTVTAGSRDERGLFAAQSPAEQIHGVYLQPDAAFTGFVRELRQAQGIVQPPALNAPQRLARDLDLENDQLSMWAKPGRRTLFGASTAIRHILAPDHASITFSAQSDLIRHWIIAIRVQLDRDWTWDGLLERGITIFRDGNPVGTVDLLRTVNLNALTRADRTQTELVFFDAFDPKPLPGVFPGEINVSYEIGLVFRNEPINPPDKLTLNLRLPITTPPVQTPKLVSAGIALTPFSRDEHYAFTTQRRRAVWFEFDAKPADVQDRYYCRVLAKGPDPVLIALLEEVPQPPEPDLPIDPELIRVVVPGQSADDSGLEAMQEMTGGPSPVHFMLPLPPNTDPASPDLFSFFTYELRLGHDDTRWSTAQGRFGPPLRVTGVQHPAPPMICQVSRRADGVDVSAPFATPVLDGRSLRPGEPFSDIWILMYAQVLQVDGQAWRNVLLRKRRAEQIRDDPDPDLPRPQTSLEFAVGHFSSDEIGATLGALGLPLNAPLSVLAVELIPEIGLTDLQQAPRADPLGASLGDVRILRTSPLVAVPPAC
jgi:hypothetical protein